jgi:hypothetical protein
MSNVIITIREDHEGSLDVKCEFEPAITRGQDWDAIPFTHKLAMAMMERASAVGGDAEVTPS